MTPADAGPVGADLLAAYDAALRDEAEMSGARQWHRRGPLAVAVFDHGGFVSYRDLGGLEGEALDTLVEETLAWFRDGTDVPEAEWKMRGHDLPADLTARLEAHGFAAEEVETVMVGRARSLTEDVALPEGVRVRRAGEGRDLRADLEATGRLQAEVFGTATRDLEERLRALTEHPDRAGVWLAETDDGTVVSTGRLEVVPGTGFAGLWGGATREGWRGRGIYRALVGARARAALEMGAELLHSDCSAMSRPILERSGLVPVTTTTPYVWRRAGVTG